MGTFDTVGKLELLSLEPLSTFKSLLPDDTLKSSEGLFFIFNMILLVDLFTNHVAFGSSASAVVSIRETFVDLLLPDLFILFDGLLNLILSGSNE